VRKLSWTWENWKTKREIVHRDDKGRFAIGNLHMPPEWDYTKTEEWKKKISEGKLKSNNRGVRNKLYGKKRPSWIGKMLSETRKGSGSSMYGKHLSEETKQKLSEALKGREVLQETRRRLSLSLTKYYKNGGKKLIGDENPFYGKHHTKESRRKMSESHKGIKLSLKHREGMGLAQTRRWKEYRRDLR